VAIVTDSVACLTGEQTTRYDINIVPLNIVYDGKSYRDWVDITPREAYKLFFKKNRYIQYLDADTGRFF